MTNPGEKRHTPGPWYIQDGLIRGDYGHVLDLGHHHIRPEDARLIAAAPDLYEALKGLLESKALQEAPFYNYSEAVLRGREALSRAVPEGGRD